jgi:hypothetical protein
MRAIRAASAALLGAVTLALAAPTAMAAHQSGTTPFGFTVTPSTVPAGGRVTLSLSDCNTPATVSSAVFDTVTVPSGRTVTATVDRDAAPGAKHRVTFTCGGVSGTTNLTVAPVTRAPSPRSSTGTPVASPAGVRGGLGGSIGGLSTAELVAGAGLVVVAATGTIYMARRRAEERRH